MHLKRLELNGFKSFANQSEFVFDVPIIAIVGPNGSGKSNVVEAIRFVLGEQSIKSMRGKTGSDLIFKGSRDIKKMSRAKVTIVFDNSDRVFYLHQDNNRKVNVDFDEVLISREVFTDGANTYSINGTEVRMKDVHELIASVNIGSSGHHIISQGEADRYLNANVKDRRMLIEEALGLKMYQYRIKESERKLERSLENMRESELLRRELAPHLKFLKRQVDKIERAKDLRIELNQEYQTYFAHEDYLIRTIEKKLDTDREEVQTKYQEVKTFLDQHPDPSESRSYKEEEEIALLEAKKQSIQDALREVEQEYGKISGMISVLEKQQHQSVEKKEPQKVFSFEKVSDFVKTVVSKIESLNKEDFENGVNKIKQLLNEFIESPAVHEERGAVDNQAEIDALQGQQEELERSIDDYKKQYGVIDKEILENEENLRRKQEQDKHNDRQYYEYLALKKELDGKRELIRSRDEALGIRAQAQTEELQEAKVLLGVEKIDYQAIAIDHELDVTSQTQEQHRRSIERIKIRIEDIGGGSGVEVINEYKETEERDAFLEKEINDIQNSVDSLQNIINELKETLNEQFDIGLQKINDQFDTFFKVMFGGGKAKLDPSLIKKRKRKTDDQQLDLLPEEEEEEDKEYGIDINVQLPRKKVSDLDMLSGGERSLTSIALLFALSQVNPPPFLVLDETDAALDEANSQKYGNMVESLSKSSQLILVTHNRETMSRAQTLFGVTLGRGDASTTLSLRLEDATKYAK